MKLSLHASVNNPTSVHGIYPYRGKLSPIDARQILGQLDPGTLVLDPFCGSGTVIYEAVALGHKAIGIDANPIAGIISKGKLQITEELDDYIHEAKAIIISAKKTTKFDFTIDARKHFHLESFKQIQSVCRQFEKMSPYLKACFVGSVALTARGCNHYVWTSSTVGKSIEPKRYIDFFDKFLQKVKKHYFPVPSELSTIHLNDARRLNEYLKPNSVAVVFSSPPYFDCLDYTAYYTRIIYSFLHMDHLEIKSELIQNFSTYRDDMVRVLENVDQVLIPGGKVIFVVGDKKVKGEVIRGEDFFTSISPWKKIASIERKYRGTSSAIFDEINKTKRKEQVLVWQKNR